MLNLESEINSNMMSCWTPANIAVVDETLVPFKGRNNPHHVFIMRKPNPHGLKNWSLVDYSGYFFAFSLFRRDRSGQQQTYEAADQTLLRMASVLPPGTLICADSYFGSLKALEGLAKQGKYGLFSCNSKRDTFIFKEDLHKKVNCDGESSSLYGSVEGMNGARVPFIANCFQSEGRKLNTMGSVYSDVLSERSLEVLLEDDSEEKQAEYKQLLEMRPLVRVEYAKIMSCVDNADQATMAALPKNRRKHWTSAEKVWEIIMLLSINAKKLHESASGLLITAKKWKETVTNVLLGYSPKGEHPSSARVRKGK
jgi:hypothetical protein